MALETLTVELSVRAGDLRDFTNVTIAGGFRFWNDGKTLLFINNDAGAVVIGVVTVPTQDGLAVADLAITVTASEVFCIGPFPVGIYNDGDDYVVCTTDQDLATTFGARAQRVV